MARPSPLEIYALLDRSNCKDCGRDTCMAFATDLLERKVIVQDCTHLMQDPKQAKKRDKLIKIVTPPQKPVTIGVGDRKCIIGGEEVLNRHSLTFYNETQIFMQIADDDPDLEEIAAEVIKYKKPLLYAVTKDSWEQIGKFAVENNLPVAAVSSDLDELMSLSATLQKLGVTGIVLDAMTVFGPGNVALTYDNIMQLRIAAIDKGDVNAGWPIMGVPAAYWSQVKTDDDKELWEHQYQEIIMGAIMQSIDCSLIVLHSGKRKEDIWALLAMMTLRQSIFSDPRIYPAVDAGIYIIGEPTDKSPIFVTSNYRLTKIPVEIDIKGANLDAWLLVVDSEGIGIESAVAGGQFNAGSIAETVKEFKMFEKVNHRILIIPGMAARLSGALEDEADAFVVVGPRDSSGIGKYIKEQWNPEEFMKQYEEMKE